jgi:hypothetical protein
MIIIITKFVTHDCCTQHVKTAVMDRTSHIMCLTCWIHHLQSKVNEVLASPCILSSLPHHTERSVTASVIQLQSEASSLMGYDDVSLGR